MKTNEYDAVIAAGGVLGIGEHKVTIALQDLGERDDGLLGSPGSH